MRSYTIALALFILGLASQVVAQGTAHTHVPIDLQTLLQKKNIHYQYLTQLPYMDEAAKGLVTRKNSTRATNARYAPEWCYSEGKITTLEDGVQKYHLERYEYVEPLRFNITYNEITETGQFIAEARKGHGSVSAEDTLVIQLQEKVDGEWKDHFYFKGFYDEAADTFKPVVTKDYVHYSNSTRTGTKITTYKYYHNASQPLEYEVIAEDEANMGEADYYEGIWIKGFRNGGFISVRSAQKGVWEDDAKVEVSQLNNRKETIFFWAIAQNSWVPITQTITTYNDQNQVEEEVKKDNNGTEFVNAERNVYTYQNGQLVTHDFYDADLEDPSQWILKRNTTNTYNNANQLEETLEKLAVFVGEPLSFYKKTNYSYYAAEHASAGKLLEEQKFISNGSGEWVPEVKTVFSYSDNGVYTSYITYAYTGTDWQRSKQVSYVLDDRNHLINESNIIYTNGVETKVHIVENTYVQCNTVLSAPSDIVNPLAPTLSASPNPFVTTLTLRIDLPKASVVAVKIVNQLGQTVKAWPVKKLTQGTQELTMDLANLPAGVYICQIQTAHGTQTCRVVKNWTTVPDKG